MKSKSTRSKGLPTSRPTRSVKSAGKHRRLKFTISAGAMANGLTTIPDGIQSVAPVISDATPTRHGPEKKATSSEQPEIFPEGATKAISPQKQWMALHGIQSDRKGRHGEGHWQAWFGDATATGESEDDALIALAGQIGLSIWGVTVNGVDPVEFRLVSMREGERVRRRRRKLPPIP